MNNNGFDSFVTAFSGAEKKPKPRQYLNLPDCNITGEIISLPLAAILWCGVPSEEAEQAVAESQNMGKGIFKHPYIKCLENKTRAMYFAIEEGKLRACREHGEGGEKRKDGTIDHVGYGRRHFWAADLKLYIETYHSDDKPSFLFSEDELKPLVDMNEYQRMNNEYIKSQSEINQLKISLASAESAVRDKEESKRLTEDRLEKAKEHFRLQKEQIEKLQSENTRLLGKEKPIDDRATLLTIISILKDELIGQKCFENQAKLIEYLELEHGDRGLSESNLRNKFAEANKILKSN